MRYLKIEFVLLAFLLGCAKDENCSKSSNCNLEPDAGPCKALIKRYYFDKNEGRCKEFNWGGCAGVVPFETLEECKHCESQ